jgi:hypothetical protein
MNNLRQESLELLLKQIAPYWSDEITYWSGDYVRVDNIIYRLIFNESGNKIYSLGENPSYYSTWMYIAKIL